jgi:spermidine/putrescine transport system permease protein
MSTPEVVLGASLLTMFVSTTKLPFVPEGLLFPMNIRTILIAHVMFCISYVVVTVKARLQGFPRHLEEAAMDLGANEWTTFWKVTFPIILPGIMAAALLAFSLSIDDYVITSFTAGRTSTFPIFIWGSARVGVPVQVNVIGTAFFLIAVGFVAITTFLQGRANRPARPAKMEGATLPAPERTLAPTEA